ncbi:hypothetical protein Y1Q_0007636 [Alligator mississippiensis]|uniref:Uncharacterized protein n=1 Tax=Alligator mississippiensis TaxID=8496 RepID=A0A151NCY1_ALLMI|nr:hypothetical protein Y1Q_0007636 [Alligator mississippiensis]
MQSHDLDLVPLPTKEGDRHTEIQLRRTGGHSKARQLSTVNCVIVCWRYSIPCLHVVYSIALAHSVLLLLKQWEL